jgi:hypothetical protein
MSIEGSINDVVSINIVLETVSASYRGDGSKTLQSTTDLFLIWELKAEMVERIRSFCTVLDIPYQTVPYYNPGADVGQCSAVITCGPAGLPDQNSDPTCRRPGVRPIPGVPLCSTQLCCPQSLLCTDPSLNIQCTCVGNRLKSISFGFLNKPVQYRMTKFHFISLKYRKRI